MSELLGDTSTVTGDVSSGAALSVVPVAVIVGVLLVLVLGAYDIPPPPPVFTAGARALTMTVRLIVVLLAVASTFVYDIVYVPSTPVSTDPVDWNDPVEPYNPVKIFPDPSTVSVHEAHCSVYVPL